MNGLTESTIGQLKGLLLNGTAERSCRWNRLSQFCVSAAIGDYGVFLNKCQDIVLVSVYYHNQGRLVDIPRQEFSELFNAALNQINCRMHMTAAELVEFNMDAGTRVKQIENLKSNLYRLLVGCFSR